jgi:hypothetical protein
MTGGGRMREPIGECMGYVSFRMKSTVRESCEKGEL